MQVLKYHSPVIENIQLSVFELDVMSVSRSSMIYDFEVKISRSDFLRDKKKKKYLYFEQCLNRTSPPSGFTNVPNYFSFACPMNMISENEIPDYAGLYYIDNHEQCFEIKKPRRIHKQECDRAFIHEKVSRIYSERHFIGSCRLTYENKLNRQKNEKYFTKGDI